MDPTSDKDAHKTSRGDWKCGYCTVKDMIEMNDPNLNRNMGDMS